MSVGGPYAVSPTLRGFRDFTKALSPGRNGWIGCSERRGREQEHHEPYSISQSVLGCNQQQLCPGLLWKKYQGKFFTHGVGKSLPIRILKGNNLVIELDDVRISQRTAGKISIQFLPVSIIVFVNLFLTLWCIISRTPEDCGWKGAWNFQSILRYWQSFCMDLEVKGVPLSLSMTVGIPYCGIIS